MPAGTREFRILGPLEVVADGQPVGLGGSRQRALLAFLLLHANEVVSRDRLIEALWSERAPGDAGHSLDVQISRLRKALRVGGSTLDRLITRPGGYELRVESDELDMAVFERLAEAGRRARAEGETALAARQLREALALWRGPPIGDLANEPFATTEIERLEALRLAALEERIEADLALGEDAELVPELETLVARHPLRERLYGQLMVALDRSGRRAQALGVYAEARRHLVEELGIEPGEPLRRLHETILGADPGVGPPAISSRGRPAASRGLRRVAIGVAAAALAAGGLALALGGHSGGARAQADAKTGSVTFLDSATGRLVGSAPVPPTPGLVRYGEGSFWAAADGGTLTQIDPKTFDVVRTVPVGVAFGDVAVGEGAVWLTDANSQTLLRVEPGYGTVDRSALPSTGLAEPGRGGGVAVGGGSVWVAHGNSRVERIDPTTRRVEHRFKVAGAQTVTFGGGAAWVASGDLGTLTKIDSRTNSIAAKTELQPYVCCVAVGGGFAWATIDAEHTVWKVSPTGRPLASIRTAGGAGNIAYGEGALWVSNAGAVTRIDSKTDATRTFRVGHLVTGVAVHGGLVAVNVSPTTEDLTAGLRGRIVRLALTQDWLRTTDPAVADTPKQWQLEYATCAKLLNYPDAPAPRGWTLVPEAARALPTVSRDGLTYTFQIRPGFQFSPPSNQAVTAGTFRDTIERALSPRLGPNAPAAGVVSAIVGATAYRAGRAPHVAGLTAHGAILRIRLRRRVPDLAQRMALPYFCAVPPGTPVAPNGLESPIPSAGPYYLSGHLGGVVAVVRRNPNYDGPRPHRIDAFLYREGVTATRGADAVREGRADYVSEDDPMLAAGGPLQREFGSGAPTGGAARPHYALTPRLLTFELVFNTHRSPFADKRLRRVVNEALDRDALATAIGGLPTGQILPPGMPGFREARIHQLSGSDLRAARSLVDRRARPAVLDVCRSTSCHAVGELVRDDLARIGIRLTVRSLADPLAHARAHPGGFDLLLTVTSAKYPDPVGFLRRALHGSGGSRASALLRHATRLDGTRRAAAIGAADVGLMRAVAPVAPLATGAAPELFGARIGCRIAQPVYFGVDLAAMCIRDQ